MRGVLLIGVLLALFSPWAKAGALQGKVTRSDTHALVVGAQVLVRGTNLQGASGQDGRYLILNIPAGSYGITCSAPGLKGTSTGAIDFSLDVTHDFNLDPPAANTTPVTGTTTCVGTPCGGVIVTAIQGNIARGGVGLSDSTGAYGIEGLRAGSYQISAVAYGYLPATVPDVVVTAPTDAGVTPVVVNIDLTAGPTSGVTVSGVVGLFDNPLDLSNSIVRCNGPSPTLSSSTGVGGDYELAGVPVGPMSFSASHVGYLPQNQIDVVIASNTSLNFVLSQNGGSTTNPTYTLSGTVTLAVPDGGSAGPGPTRVNLWATDVSFQQSVLPDGNGHYQIPDIPPGNYQAGAAREGFTPVTTDPFNLAANGTQDFALALDPAYDWGPGVKSSSGCSHAGAGTALGLLTVFALLSRKRWSR